VTRIVGGAARGRRLRVPDTGTRPTSDRAREAVFSSLESIRGQWHGAVVLDLYAGSGALGLEGLSRGAAHVDLIESDRAATRVLEANAAAVAGTDGVGGSAQVHAMTVRRWLTRRVGPSTSGQSSGSRYDVVFCDPPYTVAADEVAAVLSDLAPALTNTSVLVVERPDRGAPWVWPSGLVALRDRAYGEAHLWIGGVQAVPGTGGSQGQ
jgi:16S rRNA (guanine966-N2)-methyltransferase